MNTLELVARQTRRREYQYHHNIELNETNFRQLGQDLKEGDKIVVRNTNNEAVPACYGRVHEQNDFEDDEFGLGYTLRYALGVPEGEAVQIERLDPQIDKKRLSSQFADYAFGIRPVICRIRMAVEPDPGFRVCRITEETRELLGIDYGDHVVLETAEGRARDIKALPLDGKTRDIKNAQKEQNPERYPSCFDVLDIKEVRGTEIDIPEAFIDRDIREDLGILDKKGEGVCQPVVVYRDTRALFGRIFLDIATPLIIAAAAAVIGLHTPTLNQVTNIDTGAILLAKAGLIILAMSVAIIAVWYRTRIVLLD